MFVHVQRGVLRGGARVNSLKTCPGGIVDFDHPHEEAHCEFQLNAEFFRLFCLTFRRVARLRVATVQLSQAT